MIEYTHYDECETEITIDGTFAISRLDLTEFKNKFDELIEKYRI